jgi:hypothetical protein
MAMATETGKKRAKTGVRIVPNPNPEKKVRQAATSALALTIRMSMHSPVGPTRDAYPGSGHRVIYFLPNTRYIGSSEVT